MAKTIWEHLIQNENEKDYESMQLYCFKSSKLDYSKNGIEWPYSSIHRYIDLRILPENWTDKIYLDEVI